jgi:hypothetical protein
VDKPTCISIDTMRNTIDLDPIVQLLSCTDDVETPAKQGEPLLKLSEALPSRIDARSIDFNPILLRTEAVHEQ